MRIEINDLRIHTAGFNNCGSRIIIKDDRENVFENVKNPDIIIYIDEKKLRELNTNILYRKCKLILEVEE